MRKAALSAICEEFGKKYYQLFRTYGWVAAKWPESYRNDRDPWSFWVQNEPGEARKTAADVPPVTLEFLEAEELSDGTTVYHGAAPNGRRYTMRKAAKTEEGEPT